jgi:hypothetical protein
MKRPTKELEKLRKAIASGKIDPIKIYRMDIGDGQIMTWTGAQLLETATAMIAFAEAEKRGDKPAMLAAHNRLMAQRHG